MKQSPIHLAVLTLSRNERNSVSQSSNLHLRDLSNDLKRFFNPFVIDLPTFLESRVVRIPIEAEDEVRFVGRDGD